jgi:acyl carrier protein
VTVAIDDPLFVEVRALVEKIAAHRAPADVGWDTRLGDDFWLDSIEMLEMLIACETTFGVAFDGRSDFESGALDTLGNLTDLVRSKLVARNNAS